MRETACEAGSSRGKSTAEVVKNDKYASPSATNDAGCKIFALTSATEYKRVMGMIL